MDFLYEVWTFTVQLVEGMWFLPSYRYVFLLAAVSFIGAWVKQQPFRRHLWKRHHWLALTQFLFIVAATFVGEFWPAGSVRGPDSAPVPNPTGNVLLDVVAFGSLASGLFWVWNMKGFRWWAVSLIVMAEVLLLVALFVAGMAVSGDWI
jgi:hypothetical protein